MFGFFFKYVWFTALSQFLLYSIVAQSYIYIHSFSHTIFHHGLSQETGYSSLCCTYPLLIHSKCNSFDLPTPHSLGFFGRLSCGNKDLSKCRREVRPHLPANWSVPFSLSKIEQGLRKELHSGWITLWVFPR